MGSHSIPSAEARIFGRLLLKVRARLSKYDRTQEKLAQDAVWQGTDACCVMQGKPLLGRRYMLHSSVHGTVPQSDP